MLEAIEPSLFSQRTTMESDLISMSQKADQDNDESLSY
jgi:hypothetical protein